MFRSALRPPFARGRGALLATVPPAPSAPAAPNTPSPTTGGTKYYASLSWVAAGATKFDVYLDTNPTPSTLVSLHQVGTTFTPTVLPGTTYYWQVIAFNDGGQTAGPIWSFTTPAATSVIVSINGAIVTTRMRSETLTVHDPLGATAKTALARFDTVAPIGGQIIKIGLGGLFESDSTRLLFAGETQDVDQVSEELLTNVAWDASLIDWTVQLNKRYPFGSWSNVSATTIARYLIAVFAPGFTSVHVQDGLPAISITFNGRQDFSTCMAAIATAMGGHYAGPDFDKDLHLFLEENTDGPDPIDNAHRPLDEPTPLSFKTSTQQIRTRALVTGAGVKVLADLAVGETIVPVSAMLFEATGGQALLGSAVLSYGGIQIGGGGALVGPGVLPSTPPTLILSPGAGLGVGQYLYSSTDVTAAGETAESPLQSITTSNIAAPMSAPVRTPDVGGGTSAYNIGDTVDEVYTYSASPSPFTAGTVPSPTTTFTAVSAGFGGYAQSGTVSLPMSSDPAARYVCFWRQVNGGGFKLMTALANVPGGANLNAGDGHFDLGLTLPAGGAQQQVAVVLPIGAAGTLSRNLYRTVVNGTQRKLVVNIPDNTTITPYIDAVPDASLGANAPTGDTSGLTAPVGGGGFSTTGVTFATDGAATAATSASPVFTSASYTFVAGDVGAFLYIKSGTNWTPGSYLIASVAAGAATLVGACAAVASPSSATWGIDYSRLASPRLIFSDLHIDASTNTKFTSAGFPVGVNFIGNSIAVSNGLGFVRQIVTVVSVSGTTATCDKSLGTLSSTGGIGRLGGATASAVAIGASSAVITSAGGFQANGGWAITSQVSFRYTGISGSTLTGIPATGPGSVTTPIPYNTAITAAPALTGVNAWNGLWQPASSGDALNLWVQVDDLAAQAALGQLELDDNGNPTDGIHEYPISDQTLTSVAMCVARGTADLALFSRPIVTATYCTNDPKTRSGKTVSIDLTTGVYDPAVYDPSVYDTVQTWGIAADFVIQDVVITQVDVSPNSYPLYTVTASSVRFTLEDIIRRQQLAA